MSIDSLLNDLIDGVDDATGAIIVAVDGEAVQWGTSNDTDRLRLRSAYVAVVMQHFRAAAAKAGLGHLQHVVVEYKGATIIAHQIDEDCSVMLELKSRVGVSRALYRMQTTIVKIREELLA